MSRIYQPSKNGVTTRSPTPEPTPAYIRPTVGMGMTDFVKMCGGIIPGRDRVLDSDYGDANLTTLTLVKAPKRDVLCEGMFVFKDGTLQSIHQSY